MSDKPISPTFTEAPASWNVRYQLNGFECQLTLRAENGKDVLERATAALKHLAESGAQPITHTNGAQPKTAVCELHNAEMRKHEANGEVWFSHKLADGSYCKGKAK